MQKNQKSGSEASMCPCCLYNKLSNPSSKKMFFEVMEKGYLNTKWANLCLKVT